MVHSKVAREVFINRGEPCFVFARDSRDGSLYFLPDDPVSDHVRQLTRQHLRCPVPGCEHPALRAVDRGSKRRNGFSHQPGAGGHAGMSMEHLQAQLMLLNWVRLAYPQCDANLEWHTEDGARVADLMVTFPTGQQVALEVQYSAQPVRRWQARHASYRAQGIVDVWLLGNRPPHLRVEDSTQSVVLTDTHMALIEEGLPLLWVNPDQKIATATVSNEGHAVDPTPSSHAVQYVVDSIGDCELTPHGLCTPTMRRNREQQRQLEEAQRREAVRRARQQERQRALELARAEQRESAARAAQQYRQQHARDWAASPLRSELIGKYGKRLPQPITDSPFPDGGVFADPQHWHAILCRDLLQGRPGSSFTVVNAYSALHAAGIQLHPTAARRSATVVAYLERLHELGLIRLERDPANPNRIVTCAVLMDLDGYEAYLDQQHERARQDQEQSGTAQDLADRQAAEQQEAEAAARNNWDYQLEAYDGNVGRVRHFVPGTDPVLRWHERVISAMRDREGPQVAPYPDLIRTTLWDQLSFVPDEELACFLSTYRDSLAAQTPVD